MPLKDSNVWTCSLENLSKSRRGRQNGPARAQTKGNWKRKMCLGPWGQVTLIDRYPDGPVTRTLGIMPGWDWVHAPDVDV
jgi:hypothetical protein